MKYQKAAEGLNLLNKSGQKITTVVKPAVQKAKYAVTECFQLLKNMYTQPTYTELCITAEAWMKLMAFIHLIGEYEISGFARIQKGKMDGKEMPLVTDFDIIEQEVKAAYVESDAEAVTDFLRKLPADQRGEWVLDWHSHVNMSTGPSGTDWDNYHEMLKARMNNQFPAMIVNKKGEVTANQIICNGRHTSIQVYVEKVAIDEDKLWAIYQECKEKIETLCTKAYVATSYSYGGTARQGTGNVGFTATAKENDYYDYYDSDYYTRHWWEKEEDEDEDEEVAKAKKEGYVFEDVDDDHCAECGNLLVTPQEKSWGVCNTCFEEALRSQGA